MQTQEILNQLDSLTIVIDSRLDNETKARLCKLSLPALKAAIILIANDTTRHGRETPQG